MIKKTKVNEIHQKTKKSIDKKKRNRKKYLFHFHNPEYCFNFLSVEKLFLKLKTKKKKKTETETELKNKTDNYCFSFSSFSSICNLDRLSMAFVFQSRALNLIAQRAPRGPMCTTLNNRLIIRIVF